MHGILLLDKPQNMTSNAALQECKRLFGARKAGHGGSLDPIADGALPILFGRYTGLAHYFLSSSKVYEGEFLLGAMTTTGDREGEFIAHGEVPPLTASAIEECLVRYRGPIMQRPPQYSAIKYKGKPSYKYARQGRTVPLSPRRVHIYALELLGFSSQSLQVRVECSKGTYIRSLAEDIGRALGCGAYVNSLRRTKIAYATRMVTMAQLRRSAAEEEIAAYLNRDLKPLIGLEEVHIPPGPAHIFCGGDPVPYRGPIKQGEVCVSLQTDGAESPPLGLAEIVHGRLCPRRILVRLN